MIATILRLNDNLEELIEKPVKGFPYFACFEDLTKHPGGYVPWHWHADIELIWVLQGSFRMDTNHHSYVLEAGEGAFINSNVRIIRNRLRDLRRLHWISFLMSACFPAVIQAFLNRNIFCP